MWSIESTTNLGRIAVPPFVPPGFAVFCTTRDFDGRLSGERAELLTDVARERFGIDAKLATCTQVHGVNVHRAMHENAWRECDSCDALWSDHRGVALGIKIADCLPVSLLDSAHAVIANAHSGWRGAVQGVTAAALDASHVDPASSFAYLGPSIRVCCFEVGEEVASQFEARYIDRTHAKPHIDLVRFTIDLLRARGFAEERISDSELCTRCEGSIFHSYRRDQEARGRNLQIAAQ
jgi:YfiH family protein